MKKKLFSAAAILLSAAVMTATMPGVSAEWEETDGGWSYSDSGAYVTGWKSIGGKTYYFNKNGIAVTGAKNIGGKKYYFRADDKGSLFTGLKTVNGKLYFFSSANKGAAVTGWVDFKGRRYYFDEECRAVRGLKEIDGNTYYFDDKGVMQTGLVYIDELVYDFGDNGVLDYSYIERSKETSGITWDMDENAVKEQYKDCMNFKTGTMLVIKTDDDLKYFVFEKESGLLFAYGSDSPMKDRTEEFSAFLEENGYTFVEETEIHEYDTLIYEKDGIYAAVSGNGSSSILLYASPGLSEEYKTGGKDALVKSAAEHGLPLD